MRRIYGYIIGIALLGGMATGAQAAPEAKRQIGYDDIAGGKLAARSVYGLRAMEDGEHYTTLSRNGDVLRWRYADGALVDTLFRRPEGFPQVSDYVIGRDGRQMLLTTGREPIYRHSSRADYYVYDRTTGDLRPLSVGGKQQEATLSPDGTQAAFVRDNDLFVVDLSAPAADGTFVERQITHDGVRGSIINGIPDWVYEEEYSFARAYEWAPGSDAIAFYRFDESGVREYSMNTFRGGLYPENYNFKYPKAGEMNSVVGIRIYRFDGDSIVDVDLASGADSMDIYVPRIEWAATGRDGDGARLAVHWLNRLQNHYRILLADATTGATSVLYEERDPRYIERINNETATFLPEGRGFVVKSERDGWMHLYRYDMAGRLQNRITEGAWEVTALYGIDAKRGRVYYQSTEDSPLGRGIYSVGLNGRGKRRLSAADEAGTHTAVFGPGYRYWIDYFSNSETPTVVTLRRVADGGAVRVLEDNAALRRRMASEYTLPRKEFFTFTTPEGTTLNGYLLKPADFDSTRRYPVLMTQYSGPGSQQVADKWGWSWEAALVREGILVACVDGRGTGFRGAEFRKCTYGNLGGLEVQDQIAAARYLGSLPYVDPARIGIYGWSFGGFMALNGILKGNDVFALAVAVAPVTSWRYYDTIYTELYNGLPQDNAAGYDDNSPIFFADRLKGKLLLAHGTGDDNVHIQNSYEMIERLVRAGKSFEMAIYPDKNHGMGSSRDHLLRRAIEFVKCGL
ncbi:S9 family peptidase [uncultured Rikenella sp.]|uniref:S9 family peptidase n=1 Tax=uncultured Rikenella sp. TaxID=368003 RepID=UPI0026224A95|nr:S9 family peptidase [uncultured Rikenella sp.]